LLRTSRPVIQPLALLVCALWQARHAHAQAELPPLQLRLSPALEEKVSPQQRDAAPTFISSQRLSAVTDTEVRLEGAVEFRRSDLVIRAETASTTTRRAISCARAVMCV
jgi:LPS-assembly protein